MVRAVESNLEMIRHVAKRLGDLRDRVVFLGGAATALLITDKAIPDVRITTDVDVIVEIASRGECYRLAESLRSLGLRKGVKYLLRADSGFFDGDLLDYLESIEAGYLIKVKLKNLDKVLAQQTWTSLQQQRGWEETSFSRQCGKWSKARTFVAVRHQTGVVDDLYKTPIYESFCYVTTEKMSPMETHRHYGKRATSETWIEECKSQMGAGYIRTGEFLANSALFQCGILAYNILKWMGLLTGAAVQRWEVKTIRLWLIRLAGKLVSSGRQLTLKVPCKFLYREQWDAWEHMTRDLCFE